MIRVLGLDLSLTSTGIALPDGTTQTIATSADDVLEVRLSIIVAALAVASHNAACDVAVIEDLPRNARGAGSTGPVHGAVALWLFQHEIPIARPAAATIKKYATGKGNSAKDAMGIAAMARAGLDFSGRPDECDAWWLRAAALDAYGHPVVTVPAAQRAALGAYEWPAVDDDLIGAA